MSANAKREGVVAQGWEIRLLGEVVKPTRPRIKPSEKPDLPFIGMEHVEAHTMKLLGTAPAGTMKSSAVHFQSGDVLYGRLRPYLNKVYRPNFEGLCSAEFIVFPKTEGVDSRYLQYFMNSSTFVSFASHLNTGDRPRVDFDQLAPCEFPLAPLDQQKRIVAEIEKQFSRLDEAVANLKRVKANLKRYKAAVLKAAVSGRLVETEAELARREGRSYETGGQLLQRILETRRSQWKGKGKYKEPAAPDTTDLPELPEGWVWASLDELSDVVRGGSPRPAGDPRYFGGPVPWITVGPLTADESDYLHRVPEGLTFEGKERSRYIEPDTLLLTNSGATLGVPKISLIGGCINDGVAALLGVGYPLKRYLVNFLRTKTMTLRRINQGAAQPNLNTSIIKAMIVPLPPEAEQHQIVAEVDLRLSLLRETEAQVDANFRRAERMRQSILSRAFSGELINESTFLYTTAAASAI